MDAKTLRWTHAATLALHMGLITALLFTAESRLGLCAALLLLAPLPGLLKAQARTAAWASMLLVFYVAVLLAEGWAEPARQATAFALAVLAAADFVALMALTKVRASFARTAG